ncbi:MAG TPA: L,D-transpeptidase family protein [Terrimicrobiaceae bacterium]
MSKLPASDFVPFPRLSTSLKLLVVKRICFLLSAVVLAACSTTPTPPPQARYLTDAYATLYLGSGGSIVTKQTQAAKPQEEGFWRGSDASGAPSIVIDLGSQKAFFYKAGQMVGMSPISSGREGYRTPTGRFSIIQKDQDHLSTLYGDYVDSSGNVVVRNVGVMEDPRPPGTSFRGAPMPYFMRIYGGVGMHAGYLPGVPDSHGCIRLPLRMARVFYANAPSGTPVTVTH